MGSTRGKEGCCPESRAATAESGTQQAPSKFRLPVAGGSRLGVGGGEMEATRPRDAEGPV